MKVKLYGTRGSIPIARENSVKYGGNTTCVRVMSDCIGAGNALVIDTGSGYRELSRDLLKEGVMKVNILYTHYHHDHTQGLLLAPHTYIPSSRVTVWGPKEHDMGPDEVFSDLMKQPHFPVPYRKVRHRFDCHNLCNIGTQVLVIHPTGGFLLANVDEFESAAANGKQLLFGNGQKYSIKECLVVRMYKTVHPEYTVSYRFEENPTGLVFVFLTDHENTDGFSADLRAHLSGAHLLIQDAQYSRERYEAQTAGYGHGTPDYCVRTAAAGGVYYLGLTHHDPDASDNDVIARLEEANKYAQQHAPELFGRIFACYDYLEFPVNHRKQ